MVESRGLLLCRDLVSVDGSLRLRKRDIGNTTLSLVCMRAKYGEAVDLVRISARLSLLEMKRTAKVLEATLSRTKWKSILMCLVRAWKVEFAER
jgi:hypothetical protein